MRAGVAARFMEWTEAFESLTSFLYCDVRGLVTIGPGVLCSEALAATLPFEYPDGSPATPDEIRAAWRDVAAQSLSGRAGGGHFAAYTTIRATSAGLSLAAAERLAGFEEEIRAFFPGYDDASCDAQLPLLSKSWAGGEFEREWPKLTAAWNAGLWEEAAIQAKPSPARMAAENASYARRIASEQRHLRAAATSPDPEAFSVWP